jgi:hypothetical protein
VNDEGKTATSHNRLVNPSIAVGFLGADFNLLSPLCCLQGIFSFNLTLDEIKTLRAKQNRDYRNQMFNGKYEVGGWGGVGERWGGLLLRCL